MADYGVTSKGFVRKRYDTIYEEFQDEIKESMGVDISVNPKSYINVLISSVTDKLAEMWEVAEATYFNMFPSTAEGINLDYACQFGGVTRKEGSPSKYRILCKGNDNTAINSNEVMVETSADPKIYLTPSADSSITKSSFNKVQVKVQNAAAGEKYEIVLSGTVYEYIAPELNEIDNELVEANVLSADVIEIIHAYENGKLGGDAADEDYKENYNSQLAEYYTYSEKYYSSYSERLIDDILNGLLVEINKGESETFITNLDMVDDVEVLSIESIDEYVNHEMGFNNNPNLTTASVTTLILFETTEYGEFHLSRGAVNIITTQPSSDGLKEVSNLPSAIYGSLRETDEELRKSYIAKQAARSTAMTTSIASAIMNNCEGVLTAVCFENDSNDTNEYGMPAHSIFVVVDGGEETDIAEQIYYYKPAGITTWGGNDDAYSVTVSIPTDYNSQIDINFARPHIVYGWLKVTLYKDPSGTVPLNWEDLAIEGLQEFIETVSSGENVYIQRAVSYVDAKIPGIAYINVLGATTDTTEEEEKDGDGNPVMDDNNKPVMKDITPDELNYTLRYISINMAQKVEFDTGTRLILELVS